MKKLNVYKNNDKYYVRNIIYAKCYKKVDNKYYLTCDIKMRGYHDYIFEINNNYIIKDNNKYILYFFKRFY